MFLIYRKEMSWTLIWTCPCVLLIMYIADCLGWQLWTTVCRCFVSSSITPTPFTSSCYSHYCHSAVIRHLILTISKCMNLFKYTQNIWRYVIIPLPSPSNSINKYVIWKMEKKKNGIKHIHIPTWYVCLFFSFLCNSSFIAPTNDNNEEKKTPKKIVKKNSVSTQNTEGTLKILPATLQPEIPLNHLLSSTLHPHTQFIVQFFCIHLSPPYHRYHI